jgi:hypothetical protein
VQTLLVAFLGSPVVIWLLTRFDKKNTEQHANNMKVLQDIHTSVNQVGVDVKEVRKDLYDHIAHHAHKETNTDGTTR